MTSAAKWCVRRNWRLRDRPNAFVYQNNGKDLTVVPALAFDFAFSSIVFQHIPSRDMIENYVREVHRLLRPGALFKFQVQGDSYFRDDAGRYMAGSSVFRAPGDGDGVPLRF